MKILDVHPNRLNAFREKFGEEAILLEAQLYGKSEFQVYRFAVSSESANKAEAAGLGEILSDKGRSIGFVQFYGGNGVFQPKSAPDYLPLDLGNIIESLPEGELKVSGRLWSDILDRSLPDAVHKILNAEAPAKAVKKSQKSK